MVFCVTEERKGDRVNREGRADWGGEGGILLFYSSHPSPDIYSSNEAPKETP